MMEHIEGWLRTFFIVFEVALQHGLGYSILVGWIVAIGLTQWVKMLPWTSNNKWVIRLTALPFGFITTYSLWPIGPYFGAVRIFTAIAVGVSAPWMYRIISDIVHKISPSLGRKMSANGKPAEENDL